jgi:hypothetical protein
MLTAFKEMIKKEENNINMEDISLALYHHIVNNKIADAKEIIEIAFKKFEQNANLYAYL